MVEKRTEGIFKGYKDLEDWQKARVLTKPVYLATTNFLSEERFGLVNFQGEAMHWCEHYRNKLMTAKQAASMIKSGQRVLTTLATIKSEHDPHSTHRG